MFSIVAKWKVWYARRQLALAVREEEQMRTFALHLKAVIIPKLENALEAAEIDLALTKFIRGGDK